MLIYLRNVSYKEVFEEDVSYPCKSTKLKKQPVSLTRSVKNFCSGSTGFQVSPAGLTRGFQKFCPDYGFRSPGFSYFCPGFCEIGPGFVGLNPEQIFGTGLDPDGSFFLRVGPGPGQ